MKLNFKIEPKIHYQNCGIKCLFLLFQYYKVNNYFKELTNKDGNQSLWISDLALIALKIGLRVTLFTYSHKIFKPEWFNFSKKKILNCLRKKEKNLFINQARKSILKFLMSGGKLRFEILNAKKLKFFIKNKKPILMVVSSSVLHRQSLMGGHFIVLIGYDRNNFIILNPGRKKIKIEKVKIDLLLYAFYQWGGWAMILS
jgi:hypothetical protein